MTVVVFSIGNPGPSNRHSVGHQALAQLSSHAKQLTKHKLYSSVVDSDGTVFARSGSYMNESQRAFDAMIKDNRINLAHDAIFVVFDDFELALGKVRLAEFKKNESHNGVKCIHHWLQQQGLDHNVYKLGIGIGPKPQNASKDTMAAWVLSDFKPEEKLRLKEEVWPKLHQALEAIGDGESINCQAITKQIN
ncbi:hypothetical protein DIURU_002087 [Diutina rugosa]|uniref:Peptidyl-tRNA hydrolase n=1 Tax=Diutina rugosa TaxID=5481 RepID=A0A642URK0_DIURU|nr:uncharacterized protein DIURU_002087 [Diutina rugosa]KAA8904135.1 hypothetical protein DIURU_002087 [Diutina rugosa]